MNYIGSKYKLTDFLDKTIHSVCSIDKNTIFCDIFAGTGAVGRHFKTRVKHVIANDKEAYGFVLNRNYIGNYREENYDSYLSELENIAPQEGFIFEHYCLGGKSERQYFSDENGKKIDAIRAKIEQWLRSKEIDEDGYYFLLATLLEASDKVANTASVYGAFLKHLKKSAQKKLELKPARYEINGNSHKVYQEDANALIQKIEGDILYLDPPYNAREYGANYHVLNTIALYDTFSPKGKTGLRAYERSHYCKKNDVHVVFEALIKNAQFHYIFLSYNNEGLMSQNDIKMIMQKYGKYDLATTPHQRFKADKTENRNHKANSTFEYLYILEKK